MDNKNQVALNTLAALQSTEQGSLAGAQARVDGLQVAIEIINGLYTADEDWRTAEEAEVRATVADEVTALTTRATDAETAVTSLTGQLSDNTGLVTAITAALQDDTQPNDTTRIVNALTLINIPA